MKGKKTISASLILMLIASMVMFGASVSFAAPGTQISVDPPVKEFIGTSPGDYLNTNFVIKVNVTNVLNLYGWDIRLTYNSTLLQYVGRTVVGPNQVAPSQPANYTLTDVSVPGTIILGCAFSEVKGALPFDGSGVMEWITLKIIYTPPQETAPPDYNVVSCPIPFMEGVTFLWDPDGNAITRDPCANGLYRYKMTNAVPGEPVADFSYSPGIPFVCDTVTCTDTSIPAVDEFGIPIPGAYIVSWLWTISGPGTMTSPNDGDVMTFHCDGVGTVTVTLTVVNNFQLSDTKTKYIEQREIVGCLLDVYTSDNRFCGQTTDYVGKGLSEPCDALSPDLNITLFVEVTWNEAPVNHVLVAFEVLWEYYVDWQACGDLQEPPTGYNSCVLYRTAETDKDGIARIWFRVPTPCEQMMFGKWLVIASAKIQEVKQEDTMRFDVGHLITLTEVYTEEPEYIRDCSMMTIHVKGKSIAWMEKSVTFVVVAYDDCDVPIGQKIAKVSINPGAWCSPNHFEIILYDAIHVPQWAYVGIGKVYASAFTLLPSQCGVPYCPEKSSIFEILYVP